MHTTTLRGVFPDPKPVYRRNFIKENVKSIKQMQGLLTEVGVIQPKPAKDDKFRNAPSLIRSRDSTPHTQSTVSQQDKFKPIKTVKKTTLRPRFDRKKLDASGEHEQKFTHRSMQTERAENIAKLYETGVIKYPSPSLGKSKTSPKISPYGSKGQGDTLEEGMQNLELEEKDFVKENMQNFKPKIIKQITPKVPAQAPPTYQRGVLPKYLRGRKEETTKDIEEEPCPDGHVLLPEEERKETLRVLRQSYADRIQELNSLPVRSDTLRIKRRKTELEEELKRIDGGIKVFQRPKVYVKINA